jgi:hypothetical protein
MRQVIKVRAGNGMVSHLSTLGPTTPRRFVGWRFDPNQVSDTGRKGAYIKTDEIEELLLTKQTKTHYIKMVQDGSLIAADKETAILCGVPFQGNN